MSGRGSMLGAPVAFALIAFLIGMLVGDCTGVVRACRRTCNAYLSEADYATGQCRCFKVSREEVPLGTE